MCGNYVSEEVVEVRSTALLNLFVERLKLYFSNRRTFLRSTPYTVVLYLVVLLDFRLVVQLLLRLFVVRIQVHLLLSFDRILRRKPTTFLED